MLQNKVSVPVEGLTETETSAAAERCAHTAAMKRMAANALGLSRILHDLRIPKPQNDKVIATFENELILNDQNKPQEHSRSCANLWRATISLVGISLRSLHILSLTTVMRRAMPPIIECNIFSVFLPFHSKPCIHLYLIIFRLETLCCPEHHFFSNQKWVRIHLSKVTRRNFSNPAELLQRTASTDNKRFCRGVTGGRTGLQVCPLESAHFKMRYQENSKLEPLKCLHLQLEMLL